MVHEKGMVAQPVQKFNCKFHYHFRPYPLIATLEEIFSPNLVICSKALNFDEKSDNALG
jgi:hypothetical protein